MSNGTTSGQHNTIDFTVLTPAEQLLTGFQQRTDPLGVTSSMMNAMTAWYMHPQELFRAMNAVSGDVVALYAHILKRAMGLPSADVVQPHHDDERFRDPVWDEVPSWDIVKETYLAFTHRIEDMLFEAPGLSEKSRRRAAFWMRNWLNAVAPTNFLPLNPVALRKAIESNGDSLRQGWQHFMRDMEAKNVLMVEPDAFKVGKDLGTTAGDVVFRNRLVEIIHYRPTTEKVRAIPIVIITPWINKFYILDLVPKKSMVKFLVDQGYSVFITSWKNPGPELSEVRFDDYLVEGVDAAVTVARNVCKVPQVHLTGYCIGGTLVTTYMAWVNKKFEDPGQTPVSDFTLFTTLNDFSRPGDIDVFIDEASVEWIESNMRQKGYLDGGEMASAFRMLRSNTLIWHYWVHSYLYGEKLPPFDVLFWNMDSTRMPRAMHSFYLREMYLENNLIKRDRMVIAGEPIDFNRIVQPLYAVTAEDDHIAPWKQCYRIRKYVSGPVRFVLSTSGHILGIINPPVNPPKRSFWAGNPERNDKFDHFLANTQKQAGSWWEDWNVWLSERSGDWVEPPQLTKPYASLCPAPGSYVLEK